MSAKDIDRSLLLFRAKSLAIVYLTRRDDISVSGIDSLEDFPGVAVTILEDGSATNRTVIVYFTGKQSIKRTPENADSEVEISFSYEECMVFKNSTTPVCLFVFSMETDKGFYSWIKEPIVKKDEDTELVFSEWAKNLITKAAEKRDDVVVKVPLSKNLTNKEIDKMIKQVNGWYDKKEVLEMQYTA
ncbi:MAG: DUF4365 domain-containing protein [Blastocatellia bacterium]|nr:DUF4365 domain-containing protein [Blastocatellia bacterium]